MEQARIYVQAALNTLSEYIAGFMSYYQANIPLTQRSHPITYQALHGKRISLKALYIIDRFLRKILTFHLGRTFQAPVPNYEFGGPVPDIAILDFLHCFKNSICRNSSVLQLVISRTCSYLQLQIWYNIFQRLISLLGHVRVRLSEVR